SSTQIHQPPSLAFDLFCFNTAATTEIYTLSLHDALPIFSLTGRNEIREAGDVLFHRPFFGGYHAKGTPLRAASRQKANGVILVVIRAVIWKARFNLRRQTFRQINSRPAHLNIRTMDRLECSDLSLRRLTIEN